MFYSHEILTSTQYGVATIWLVATIGPRSNARKITRKAIQGVNIPGACDTISHPGAPIALRLQGNLLYGVSRVYSQQCAYMLTDVEKVQSHMQTFFRVWGTSSIDPQAGKVKRDQLVIQDDPAFDLNFNLPAFDLDDDGNVLRAEMSNTQKTSSQMSPHTGNGSSGSHRSAFDTFNISASPGGSGLHQLDMPFGRESLASQKPLGGAGLGQLGREEEDDQLVMDDDWGIRIDEHGNVFADEPQLPRLPPLHPEEPAAPAMGAAQHQEDEPMLNLGSDDQVLLPEDAQAFPAPHRSNEGEEEASSSTVAAAAPIRRQRRKPLIVPDERTNLSTAEVVTWSREYSNRVAPPKTRRRPNPAQALQTAYDLTFGFGIGRVGAPTGIPGVVHPLAAMFAGPALERSILGFSFSYNGRLEPEAHGHRRGAAEAFDSDHDSPSRNVRPRLEGTPQAGRADEHDAQLIPHPDDDMGMLNMDDDANLELGREAPGSAHRGSDISVPWNRPPSIPGSSAAKRVSGLGRQVSASPLHGRGGSQQLAAIERLSSDMNNPFNSDPFVPGDHSSPALLGSDAGRVETTSQVVQAALDEDGANFLEYVGHAASTKGAERDDRGRRWVEFDGLFEKEDATRTVMTQAFFHVLTLATRGVIGVRQDGSGGTEPFGAIWVGVLGGEDEGEEMEGVEGMEGFEV